MQPPERRSTGISRRPFGPVKKTGPGTGGSRSASSGYRKVKAQGGLGIINPKAQFEALLAKLLIRGLSPSEELWKEIIRSKVDQIKLPVHSMGPDISYVNWIFAAPKLKIIQCSMWKNIIGAWMKVRSSLTKAIPTSTAEILKQPIFGNPSILNQLGVPLGLSSLSQGNAVARAGCT
ncbi:unnamed protein product [Sphagnum tenellum]